MKKVLFAYFPLIPLIMIQQVSCRWWLPKTCCIGKTWSTSGGARRWHGGYNHTRYLNTLFSAADEWTNVRINILTLSTMIGMQMLPHRSSRDIGFWWRVTWKLERFSVTTKFPGLGRRIFGPRYKRLCISSSIKMICFGSKIWVSTRRYSLNNWDVWGCLEVIVDTTRIFLHLSGRNSAK